MADYQDGGRQRIAIQADGRRVAEIVRLFDETLVHSGRLGHPKEIAEVVAFLAGPGAAWITGQDVCGNGGLI